MSEATWLWRAASPSSERELDAALWQHTTLSPFLLSNIFLSLARHVQLRDIDATSLLTAPLIALGVCRVGGSGVHLFAGPLGEKEYEQTERRRCGC